jgi:hypothetical protein
MFGIGPVELLIVGAVSVAGLVFCGVVFAAAVKCLRSERPKS